MQLATTKQAAHAGVCRVLGALGAGGRGEAWWGALHTLHRTRKAWDPLEPWDPATPQHARAGSGAWEGVPARPIAQAIHVRQARKPPLAAL